MDEPDVPEESPPLDAVLLGLEVLLPLLELLFDEQAARTRMDASIRIRIACTRFMSVHTPENVNVSLPSGDCRDAWLRASPRALDHGR